MIWFFITILVLAAVASLHRAYDAGVQHGRMDQAREDRSEIAQAVIARARAEQLATTWELRAKALLIAHFGPGGKP